MSNLYLRDIKFLIIVAGPTGIGKTRCAVDLAKYYHADVFSADSRQLYKEMHIGTARPDETEMSGVRHHFIDMLSIHQAYSAGDYVTDIQKALNQYFITRNVAVVTGGTGLYIKALLEGIDDFPDVPEDVYIYYNKGFEENGLGWLQEKLATSDPVYFQTVDRSNARRLIRALGVSHVSNRPYSVYLSNQKARELPFHVIEILLELPREALYERINQRVDQMFSAGLEEEARSLYPYKYLRSLQTVGYQELFDCFDGIYSLDDAKARIKQNTRRYAKRQMTWFRKYGNWQTFHPDQCQDIIRHIDNVMLQGENS